MTNVNNVFLILCISLLQCQNGVNTINKFSDGHLNAKDVVLTLTKRFDHNDLVNHYAVNDFEGVGHRFDGIGGLSGGGATSRLLVSYPEILRSQILDFLFEPNFGASLHILKVEIGGDGQSTEGTEPSHMRGENDLNFTRGYEWWLMKEAKARNPDLTLVALPWSWPGWIGQGTVLPYTNKTMTATYVVNWILGAKAVHGLEINYVGIWNERPYDVEYIKILRDTLDKAKLDTVKIIAADGSQFITISEDLLLDKDLSNVVDIIASHYPGTLSGQLAQETEKPLWASEDFSTYNDAVGAGCWARILNQNYINGNITATIAWNLITSYYDQLPYSRCSLMTANEPWSGHYEIPKILWVTAHTTQFTKPGWSYLKTSRKLSGGGSFVSLTDEERKDLTIVIETLAHDNSVCIRPALPDYQVHDQNVTFTLKSSFKSITYMHMWVTELGTANHTSPFAYKGKVKVSASKDISIFVKTNMLITLSTVATAKKGSYPTPPASKSFPLPFSTTFDKNNLISEPDYFTDQSGSFETYLNSSSVDHQWTLRQVVTERPVTWCDDPTSALTLLGDYYWSDINVTVQVKAEGTGGVFVALRVNQGGCDTRLTNGIFFWMMNDMSWLITTDINRSQILKRCYYDWKKCWDNKNFKILDWNQVTLHVAKQHLTVFLNNHLIATLSLEGKSNVPSSGWVALGTADYGYAQFDNLFIQPA